MISTILCILKAMHAMIPAGRSLRALGVLLLASLASSLGVADAPSPIDVRTTAAVRQSGALVSADRVVPGDEVFYTLEIRNTGATPLTAPTIDFAIPEHMRYVANSAAGAGAEVSYSIDGGRTFDRPENLVVAGDGGQPRVATASDYTHIRWRLKHVLKSKAMALARFRAIVK
jgi:uncharacterized repeat protein (TIGR01451 family)